MAITRHSRKYWTTELYNIEIHKADVDIWYTLTVFYTDFGLLSIFIKRIDYKYPNRCNRLLITFMVINNTFILNFINILLQMVFLLFTYIVWYNFIISYYVLCCRKTSSLSFRTDQAAGRKTTTPPQNRHNLEFDRGDPKGILT